MANKLSIDIDFNPSLSSLSSKFLNVDIKSALQEGIETYAFTVEKEAKKETPVDTGRLRSSILTDIGNLQARIKPHANYALFVHEGTRYMKGRPFMTLGLNKATATLFSGGDPFKNSIEKELHKKLT